jgi:anti-sigma B factor antagonist
MNIRTEKHGEVTVIRMSGSFAFGGDVQLRGAFGEQLANGERSFILDMSDVAFIDSVGLGETVACTKRIRERGGSIILVLAEIGKTREVFTITGVDRAFKVFTNIEAALAD